MSNFSLDVIKQNLIESNVMVLRDMTMPADINGGHILAAKSFPLTLFFYNKDISDFIVKSGATHVAFYKLDDTTIRFGTLNLKG